MDLTAAEYGSKLNLIKQKLVRLLQSPEWKDTDLQQKLERDLSEFQDRGLLTIAFIGEYSAGKSSLISALTSRRDIKISADITTDQCQSYEWNGVHLVDTPGLWTERQDHDEITYRAIAKADLLVFCLTYSLFNTTTLSNFKQLAYDQNYQGKMMLLLNKMSGEGGPVEERIQHYKASLQESLYPNDLSAFPLVFCDACDQIEGQDEEDEELKQLSRFDAFIDELNSFIERKRIIARLDTPLRILLSYLDAATHEVAKGDDSDGLRSHILRKLGGVIERSRRTVSVAIDGIILTEIGKIKALCRELVLKIGVCEDFEHEHKTVLNQVQKIEQDAYDQISQKLEAEAESLSKEMNQEFNHSLMESFLTRIQLDSGITGELSAGTSVGAPQIFKHLHQLALASGLNFNVGFVTASQASKLPLASIIRGAGKWSGFKFQPWGAANMAKGMTNAIPIIGMVLAGLCIAFEVGATIKEKEKEKELTNARWEVRKGLEEFTDKVEVALRKEAENAISDLLGEAESHVNSLRKQFEEELASHHEIIKTVNEIRMEAEGLLRAVHQGQEG